MTQAIFTLNNLILSPLNMRQGEDVDVSDLVASMKARIEAGQPPLIQNLRVTKQKDAEGAETGVGEVHVGGRRLRALNVLLKAKVIKKTFEVVCSVCDDAIAAMDESLEENIARVAPHPADQYLAFAQLSDAGQSVDQIAARHGLTELVVRRRLALGKLSPKLLDVYRQGDIDAQQLKALCLTDDQAMQEAAWFDIEAPWQRRHDHLRQKITQGEVASRNNALVAVVGLDAYKAAGGAVRVDLFSDNDDVFIQDVALLEKLALVIIDAKKAEIEGEGWKWVEFHPSVSYPVSEQWTDLEAHMNPLADDVAEKLAQLQAEIEAEREAEEVDYDRLRELKAEASAITDAAGTYYKAEEMALAGVVLTVQGGALTPLYGKLTKADKKAIKALTAVQKSAGGTGIVGTASNDEAGLSAALTEDLSAQHTLAMRAAMLDRPDVALLATVHRLLVVSHYRYNTDHHSVGTLTLSGVGYNDPMKKHCDAFADTKAGLALAEAQEKMATVLPEAISDLWSFLLSQNQEKLLQLLAYASSGLVEALQGPFTTAKKKASTYELADALSLDMADYWTATAEGFFKRTSKPVTLDAVREVVGAPAADGMAGLKKSELAEKAEAALDGSRWLPAILRSRVAVEEVALQEAA